MDNPYAKAQQEAIARKRAALGSLLYIEPHGDPKEDAESVRRFIPKDIHDMLRERGKRYGEFKGHAKITQALKLYMSDTAAWENLSDDKREALEMIAHKIGRILNGDPNYKGSWVDIAGYATLVADKPED